MCIRGEIYNRLSEANKSSIVPSTQFFRETMDYLVLETMNKAITSPIFVEQRHVIERVERCLIKLCLVGCLVKLVGVIYITLWLYCR